MPTAFRADPPEKQDMLHPTGTFVLTEFLSEHIAGAHALTQSVGWPHRPEDWALVLSVSEGVVVLSDDRVVGCGICSGFGGVATLNSIVVDESLRGQGIGKQVMNRLFEIAGDRALRLVATAEGLPLYEKLGFATVGRIHQHQGIAKAATPQEPVWAETECSGEALAVMDAQATGLRRETLITTVAREGTVLRAARGFALLRDFGRGQVVGPIIAEDEATARALLAEAANRCQGQFLRVDLTEQAPLKEFAEALGLADVGGGADMMRGSQTPPTGALSCFALFSQALA